MNGRHEPDAELTRLIDAAIEGELSPETRARLEERLESDPRARSLYLEHIELHALLEWEHGRAGAPLPRRLEPSSRRGASAHLRGRRPFASERRRLVAAAAAIVTVIGIAGVIVLRDPLAGLSDRPGGGVAVAAPYYAKSDSSLSVVARHWTPAGESDARRLVPIDSGTVRIAGPSEELRFRDGIRLRSRDGGAAHIGIVTERHVVLFEGAVEVTGAGGGPVRTGDPAETFIVDTPSVRLVHSGAELSVRIEHTGATVARAVDGAVEARVRTRAPRWLWTFDEGSPGAAGSRHGPGVELIEGIVGAHAARFDDTRGAYIDLGDGHSRGETGRGAFAVSTGLTIEALIIPEWTGRGASTGDTFDYDEIFRKEDGDYRILLSFQNDTWEYEVPNVEPGPCLSFGLFLAGLGYSELDMPLDGREGRPRLEDLRDGRAHHVVATYDGERGAKAIYIDGVRCFGHEFPERTLAVSGGPANATIGNSGPGHVEPFRGVLDEVAFYDFALGPDEVAAHYRDVRRGLDYFGRRPDSRSSRGSQRQSLSGSASFDEDLRSVDDASGAHETWRRVAALPAGLEVRFDADTGLPEASAPAGQPDS